MAERSLGVTELYALSREVLIEAGYSQGTLSELGSGRGRLFEDMYGLVCVAVFRTWTELINDWPDVFGELVDLVSVRVPATDAKSWETYLVMMTPDAVPTEEHGSVSAIRYDMRRVRKLVATGDELRGASDVERVLRPLLPLHPIALPIGEDSSALDLLPGLLASQSLPVDAIVSAVHAFKNGQAVITALDGWAAEQ